MDRESNGPFGTTIDFLNICIHLEWNNMAALNYIHIIPHCGDDRRSRYLFSFLYDIKMRRSIIKLFNIKNYANTVNEVLEVQKSIMLYDLIFFVRQYSERYNIRDNNEDKTSPSCLIRIVACKNKWLYS